MLGQAAIRKVWLMMLCAQTKDFMKFLGIVIILYMGKAWADIPHRLAQLLSSLTRAARLFDDLHLACSRRVYLWGNVMDLDQGVFWVRLCLQQWF